MKTPIALTALFLTSALANAQKKPEEILYEVSAPDMTKVFKDDPAKAKTKYDPNPPKGGAGGAIIKLTGEVEASPRAGVSRLRPVATSRFS